MTTATETTPDPLPSARLFYRDGSSDKVYHASIIAVDGGYSVTFAYGRRSRFTTSCWRRRPPKATRRTGRAHYLRRRTTKAAGRGCTRSS